MLFCHRLGSSPNARYIRKEGRNAELPARFVFATRLPLDLHLRAAVWPACSSTRCPAMLRAGLPSLTFCGGSFASRAAAGLLINAVVREGPLAC